MSTSTDTANPYIVTDSSPSTSPADCWGKCGKLVDDVVRKAEITSYNVWQHLKTSPNIVDTAFGKLSLGTKLLAEGGPEKVYKRTFETFPDDKLLSSYACYFSTSSGPLGGTLYISTQKVAFCSDPPLSHHPSLKQAAWSYYKVVISLDKLQAVNPVSSFNKKWDRYIQLVTVDNYEFWFLGFVNYDKALKSLQDVQMHRL